MEEYKIPKLHKNARGITVENGWVYTYHTHMHSYYEMTLYEPFTGTVTVNDRVFTMDTPTAVLVVPSDFHRIEPTGRERARYIKVGFEADLPGDFPLDSSLVLQGMGADDFLLGLFREIGAVQPDSPYGRQLVRTAAVALAERGAPVQSAESTAGSQLAKRAVGIIHESFSRDISLASVARELSVSPQYLSAVFKASMGINFSKYLCGVRLRRAAKLLTDTERSITDICGLCGYGNFSHFLRSFKALYGCSPSAYRKK